VAGAGDVAGGATAAGGAAAVATCWRVTFRTRKPTPFKTTNTRVIAIVRIGRLARFDASKLADYSSSIDSSVSSIFWWHGIIHFRGKRKASHTFRCACFAQLDGYADSLE
jgi:hypothetical protein